MSYKKSNLYASRVFAEHPVALWAMDEDYYFLSLIDQENKRLGNFSYWSSNNCTSVTGFTTPVSEPIDAGENLVSKFYLTSANGSNPEDPEYFTVKASNAVLSSRINLLKDSICASVYVYIPNNTSILNINLSFSEGGVTKSLKTYRNLLKGRWQKLSVTLNDVSQTEYGFRLDVYYAAGTTPGEEGTSIYFSSLSIGQWSEPFNGINSGSIPETIPLSSSATLFTNPAALKCLPLDPYGFNDADTGYFIKDEFELLAELGGVPMAYGSKGNVNILPSSGSITVPSLFFPGKGLFNESGKNNDLTLEFWLRINNESVEEKRIFGPLTSDDGLYVEKDFIKLKVGKYVKSYFVGQWYRPMLVHIIQSQNEIALMINSEKVISISIESINNLSFAQEQEDFIGFYGHELTMPFEIDCVSIYPYVVSDQQAKIRYVFGQGVEEQGLIIERLGGDVAYIDFPLSGYNSTVSYPDRNSWGEGYSNNLDVSSEGISPKQYSLPQFRYSSDTGISNIELDAIFSTHDEAMLTWQTSGSPVFYTPYATVSQSDHYATLYYDSLNILSDQVKSIHASFIPNYESSSEQSLLYFVNNVTGDYLDIVMDSTSSSISYIYNSEILESKSISSEQVLCAGIDIDKFSNKYSSTVGTFFNYPSNISLTIFGKNKDTAFRGQIYNLTFNNSFFLNKDMSNSFNSNGIINKVPTEFDPITYVGAYTLLPKLSNSSVYLDIATVGYWEDSIPMSFFGRYIKNSEGDMIYDLDLLQFNIDIPSVLYTKNTNISLAYGEASNAKTYITIKNKNDLSSKIFNDYTQTQVVEGSRLIDFDQEVDNLSNTKYKVFDGTVILAPKAAYNYSDYYITTHILLKSDGINTENIKVKKMSIASSTFDNEDFYGINTPTAMKFFPISKIQDEYIHNKKIPTLIGNESAPYLYLTKDSGIINLPDQDSNFSKGILTTINKEKKEEFTFTGIQMFLLYNADDEFEGEKLIGKIITPGVRTYIDAAENIINEKQTYDIILVAESNGKRAKIKIINSYSFEEKTSFKYYLNGKLVNDLIIKPEYWNHIAISFEGETINMGESIGSIEVYSGVCVNNIATFKQYNTVTSNITAYDHWIDVLANLNYLGQIESYNLWSLYSSGSANWTQILNEVELGQEIISSNIATVFDSYAGISSIIVSDDSTLTVNSDSYGILNGVRWTTFEETPI